MNTTLNPARVALVTAEPIRLAGLESAFENHPLIATVSGDLEALLGELSIGYLVLDVRNNSEWTELQFRIRRTRPDIRLVVIGPSDNDEIIVRSILGGARAVVDVHCGPLMIRQAVEAAMQGLIWAPRRILTAVIDRLLSHPVTLPSSTPVLSPRERQVLDLIMTARSNREIASELGIEERTVKAYVANLLRKTGAGNRVSLSVLATQESMREHPEMSS